MKWQEFSKKQLDVLSWWCPSSPNRGRDALICDGAVRSGKTLCMFLSFVFWGIEEFSGGSLAVCGKTVTSLRRNIIKPLCPILRTLGFSIKEVTSRGQLEIAFGERSITLWCFGGRDESSSALIQGMTLCGVLLDEVALMPRSFVEQAIARCSVEGSKFWFNCNPESPSHWFYNEWIKKAEEKNAYYVHFTMQDNPSLSKKLINRYEKLYTGAFYERFIKGRWVANFGLVYPQFGEACIKELKGKPEKYYISCDYGTVNPSSFGLWGLCKGVWYRMEEYYYDSKKEGLQLTDEEYYAELCRLAGDRRIEAVICDPAAASFITLIRKNGRFLVLAAKNEVIDGIRRVSDCLKSGRIKISPQCRDIIREFGIYRWDDNSMKDAPRKENDHAMDDMRYFVSTVLYGGAISRLAGSIKR